MIKIRNFSFEMQYAVKGFVRQMRYKMISDKFVKGMKVNGFVGAIVVAIGIAIVTWLVNWVLSLFM